MRGALIGIWLLVASPAPTARFPKGLHAMVLPAPPSDIASWRAEDCTGCHAEQARDHALSAHAVARSNTIFQAGLQADQPEWCVGCHAPQADEPDGISCGACHAAEHGVAAAASSGRAPHAVQVVPSLTDGTLCAQCHEFGFSLRDAHGRLLGLSRTRPQQSTFSEWRRWQQQTHDARTCITCHGPGHAFGGRHPIEALRSAIRVRAAGDALELSTDGVGHALPTGDVMRWLSVEVSSDALFERRVVAATIGLELGTRLWPGEELPGIGAVADTRLQPGEIRRVPLPKDVGGAPPIAWRVVYHLVSDNQEQRRVISEAASRVVLHAEFLPTEDP